MKSLSAKLFIFFILFSIFIGAGLRVGLSQDETRPVRRDGPPQRDWRSEKAALSDIRKGKVSASEMEPASIEVLENTGGPDIYGYTWSDQFSVAWISAADGIDTGMQGWGDQQVGPIALPFPFKYYENVYYGLWISGSGYLSFSELPYVEDQSRIPSMENPNNIIAPLMTPTYIGPAAWVRYTEGGIAPNRFFVVEWHGLNGGPPSDSVGGDEIYTFEVILYENGNIRNQFQTMDFNGDYWCGTGGIEDYYGSDGLSPIGFRFCSSPDPNSGVFFTRPAASARIGISPSYFGALAPLYGKSEIAVPIRNLGEFGEDTFDLEWGSCYYVTDMQAFTRDGLSLLSDTNGNGKVDTGPIQPGDKLEILMKMNTPGSSQMGDQNSCWLSVISSINPNVRRSVHLETAVAPPFAQVFIDSHDRFPAIQLAQSRGSNSRHLTDTPNGWEPSIAELQNGHFVTLWREGRCLGEGCNVYLEEIRYSLTDQFGETVRTPTRLTDLSGAAQDTYDGNANAAVTADGKIGISWNRWLARYQNGQWEYNGNLFFVVLHPDGRLAYGPVSLTNNLLWSAGTYIVPGYYDPKITSSNNNFFIAWESVTPKSGCSQEDCYYEDIYYTVRSSSGSQVKAPVKQTKDTSSNAWEAHLRLALTGLDNGRALLVWMKGSDGNYYYVVLNNSGGVHKATAKLTTDEAAGFIPDAVQLTDGKTIVAWPRQNALIYIFLDSNYNVSGSPQNLTHPQFESSENLSITKAPDGGAILTWSDNDYHQLFYALVKSWAVITPPRVFLDSHDLYPQDGFMDSNWLGFGNTTYSSLINPNPDGLLDLDSLVWGTQPGNISSIPVRVTNHGQATGTGVSLVLTLTTGLTYNGDSSGIIPIIVGDTVTWNLRDLDFLDEVGFMLYLGVDGSAAVGDQIPFSLSLNLSGESNPADNSYSGKVMAADLLFLPVLVRE